MMKAIVFEVRFIKYMLLERIDTEVRDFYHS